MTLLLFDIDGTLVHANGTGRRALCRGISDWANQPITTDGVSFSGRTDPAIVEAVLQTNDLPTTQNAVNEALDAYIEAMSGTLTEDDVTVLPGVRDLLFALDDHDEVQLGLVTGNVEVIAYEKLAVHDLDGYFPVGAFGSDHADRDELPEIARRRASACTDYSFPSGDHLAVIGDTVHDIACARATSARAIAVCTGRYEREDLESQNPDVLVETLQPTNKVLNHLLHR